jgi:hypothetical protein
MTLYFAVRVQPNHNVQALGPHSTHTPTASAATAPSAASAGRVAAAAPIMVVWPGTPNTLT